MDKNKKITIVVFSTIGALIMFQFGMSVGYHKAIFSNRLGDRMFQELPGGHGAVGKIVSMTPPTFIISSPDNIEKTILLGSTTAVRSFRGGATPTSLNIDDMVLILGYPDDSGRIVAKLIRQLPPHKN